MCIRDSTNTELQERASEIVGQSTTDGIWFQTKSLLSTVGLIAAYKLIFPGRKTQAEELFGYCGPVYCTKTGSEIIFIASSQQSGTRQLTNVILSRSTTALVACDCNHNMTKVKFKFESGECFDLYFFGNTHKLKNFVHNVF